jgi:hypothetical protein
MLAFCRRFLLLCVLAVIAIGCSNDLQPELDGARIDSKATFVIADVTYALDVACYSNGDELTAVGAGIDAATGSPVKGMIRGPAGAYVGLMFGDDEYIYEADATIPLTIQRDGDRLSGDGISFVRDIDLGSAGGSSVGVGSVSVECLSKNAGVAPPLSSR